MTSLPMLTASDCAGINSFLSTPLGIRWLAYMMTVKPKVTIDKGSETTAMTGSYLAGYLYLLDEIIPRTRSVPIEEVASLKPIDVVRD
jgi:hypothetical protein